MPGSFLLFSFTPMKIILDAQNLDVKEIKDLKYDKATQLLSFNYKTIAYSIEVQESLGTYIKISEDDKIELINYEAKA